MAKVGSLHRVTLLGVGLVMQRSQVRPVRSLQRRHSPPDHVHGLAAGASPSQALRRGPRLAARRHPQVQHLQLPDGACAVGMQEAEVAGASKPPGQHMLQHRPQIARPGQCALRHLACLGARLGGTVLAAPCPGGPDLGAPQPLLGVQPADPSELQRSTPKTQWPSARRGWSSASPAGSTSRHQAGAATTSRPPLAVPPQGLTTVANTFCTTSQRSSIFSKLR